MRLLLGTVAAFCCSGAVLAGSQPVEAPGPLRAGASRIDYTPRASLPGQFRGVLDPIYVRSVVFDNGRTRAALVAIDAGAVPNALYRRLSQRAAAELQIPAAQLLVSASHTHSVPFRLDDAVEETILRSLRESVARLQPARVAWGTGASYINVNRDRIDPKRNGWWEGPNRAGVSDKTVAVLQVTDAAGAPIAVHYNYAVHGVVTGTLDLISGDIPGAASRYVEESLGGDAVALWSSGAAGDQNPIYFNQTYELRDIRIADHAARGEDISNAMPPGGQGLDRSKPRVRLLMEQQKRLNETLGQMLGEEVLQVLREDLGQAIGVVALRGQQTSMACPARERIDQGRAGVEGRYRDAGQVSLALGVLRIGDIYIGSVDAEVYSAIGLRLKREAPFKQVMMATLTNGMAASGYVPSDDAFGREVFTVLNSRLKPGCAEAGIVSGLVGLMRGL